MHVAPESNRPKKARKRRSSTATFIGGVTRRITSAASSLTDREIDPYGIVRIDEKYLHTKPVTNGGTDATWLPEHDHRLVFEFDYDSIVPFTARTRTMDIDIFDQDVMSDSHIGKATVNLEEIFQDWINDAPEKFKTTNHRHHREVTLNRYSDDTIAGFLTINIEYIHQKGKPNHLVVTINQGSDMWDPNDTSHAIPDDGHSTSLFVACCICASYFLVGALFFCNVENWTIIDAAYFAAATFTTVGYGDVRPVTDSGKLFACVYIIVGISIISVSLVRVFLGCYSLMQDSLDEMSKCVNVQCLGKQTMHSGNDDAADTRQKSKKELAKRRKKVKDRKKNRGDHDDDGGGIGGDGGDGDGDGGDNNGTKEWGNEGPSLKYMIGRMMFALVVMISIGTFFFTIFEGISFVDGIYMSTATVATVGYGDISPSTQGGRFFAIFWIITSYVIIVRSLHGVVDKSNTVSLEQKRDRVLFKDLSVSEFLF